MSYWTVLYPFQAEEEGELSVNAGDIVRVEDVTGADRDGWALVETTVHPLQSGFVPADYIRPLSDDHSGAAAADALSPYAADSASGDWRPSGAAYSGADTKSSHASPAKAVAAATATALVPAVAMSGPDASRPGPSVEQSLALARASAHAARDVSLSSLTPMGQGALSGDDFAQLFANHEEWFKRTRNKRAETFVSLRSAVDELSRKLADCETRNHAIVQRISELDSLIDEERLKWQDRLDQERSSLAAASGAVGTGVSAAGGVLGGLTTPSTSK